MTFRTPRVAVGILGGMVGLSGCYRYVPSNLDVVPRNEEVRVHLTGAATADTDLWMRAGIETGGQPILRGRIVGGDAEEVVLRVPVSRPRSEFASERPAQNVRVRREHIVHVERRELDRTSTGVTIGVVVGAAAGFVYFIMNDARRAVVPPPNDPSEVDESRIDLFELSVPVGR